MSNITLTESNLTNNESVETSPGEIVVEGIVIPIISLLGLIGNVLSICVLRSCTVDMKVISKTMFINEFLCHSNYQT